MLDAKKKKEKKKKYIAWQELEQRRAKARREGKPKEDSPNEDDEESDDDDNDEDVEGMGTRLERLLQPPTQANLSLMQEETPKEPQGEKQGVPKRSPHLGIHVATPLLLPLRVTSSYPHVCLRTVGLGIESRLLWWDLEEFC